MKRVILVNGSLRGRDSSSLAFLQRVSALFDRAVLQVGTVTAKASARAPYPPEVLDELAGADVLILSFPLFSYSLPGALTRLMEDHAAHRAEGARAAGSRAAVHARVSVIVNSGFPEPRVASEALRVVRNFCARMGYVYRFSIAIGTGPVTALTMRLPLVNPRLKRALRTMAKDAISDGEDSLEDVWITPVIPRPILLGIKELFERRSRTMWSRRGVETGPAAGLSMRSGTPAHQDQRAE